MTASVSITIKDLSFGISQKPIFKNEVGLQQKVILDRITGSFYF
jgi:hypothetical protein